MIMVDAEEPSVFVRGYPIIGGRRRAALGLCVAASVSLAGQVVV